MSSALWLLLYLAPLLGLTAAVFAWLGWQWRGSEWQQLRGLENQIDDGQNALRDIETARAATHSQGSNATAEASSQREQTEDQFRTLHNDLKSAQTAARHYEIEAVKTREASQALETEVAKLLHDLELLRTERDQAAAALTTAHTELAHLRSLPPIVQEAASGSTQIESATPAKPRRKRTTTAKARAGSAAAPAPLRDKIVALEQQLAAHQAVGATPAGSEIERLQNQVRVLHRTQAQAAALASMPDDDLMQIKGVKKTLSEQLRAHGIRTWRQIAQWDDDELRAFSELLACKNRASREQWQEQARRLHAAAHGPL